MNICIVGLGLLGGSLSLGLKSVYSDIFIRGVETSEENARKALELGIADQVVSFETGVRNSELVILATPVDIMTKQIVEALDLLQENAILTDLGSTKEKLCKAADQHPERHRYVAAHPIAGTENSGPDAAFSSLLKHKMMIICDREKSDPGVVQRLEDLFRTLEMRIIYMNSIEHDRHIAYVSHLSHISSFALGSTVLDKERDERSIFAMAGSGFSSTVRLAKSSPDMWAPIFSQNQKNVSEALDAYIKKLQYFKQIIDENDLSGSYILMKEANEIRRVLQGLSKGETE
jgi:prephenate dehydrogenase